MKFGSVDFLKFYETAHQNMMNRCIHHLAHIVAFVGIAMIPFNLLLLVPLVMLAFILSWSGHYIFERNVPAFFETGSMTTAESIIHQIKVALGGLWWTIVCFLRVLGLGPLTKLDR